MDAVAKAPPDGLTLGFSALSPLTLTPHVTRVPYDPLKDVVAVARVMYSPVYLLATPCAAPAGTRPEVVARLNAEVNAVRAAKDMQERLARLVHEAGIRAE